MTDSRAGNGRRKKNAGKSHSGKKLHRDSKLRMERDHTYGDTGESIQLRWRPVQREEAGSESGEVPYARSQIFFAQVFLYDVKIQNCSDLHR